MKNSKFTSLGKLHLLILPCSFFLLSSQSIGQTALADSPVELAADPSHAIVDLNQPAFYKWHPANAIKKSETSNGTRDVITYIPIGTSYNLYTILLSEQGQVSYNSDINAISFIHRQNSGTPGGSGGLSFDLSIDGGATWTNNNIITPTFNLGLESPASDGSRYPSAALWNPEGNTDPNEAYIVAHGPSLLPAALGTWGYNHQLSSTLDGDNLSEVYYSEGGAGFDYFPFGIQAYDNGNLWDIKADLAYTTHNVNKFIFNDGTNSFDKESTTLTLSWYAITPKYQVVFDESGTTGYVVIIGALADDVAYSLTPKVLKTTDGGATWNAFPYFDFSSLSAMDVLLAADDLFTKRPYFSDIDCTVDADGRLHIFADVESSYYADPFISLFTYYANYSALMHVSSSDGTDWTAEVIETNTKTDIAFGAVALDRMPQISRLEDGSKIFFTWMQSPDLSLSHDSPNLYGKGYDVATGNYTENTNFSAGTDYENSIYFPTIAPVSRNLGGTYEIPVVFADPGVSDLVAPQFYYAMGVSFTDEDFNFCNAVAPTGLYVDGITATSGIINWSAVDNADGYTGAIWNLTTGAIRKFHTSGEATSYATPSTLTPSTTYGVRMKTVCLDAGEISPYSAFYYFTTSPLREGVFTQQFSISPNPNNGNFNIALNGMENSEYQLMIYNSVGQMVYNEAQITASDLRQKELTLDVPAGTYFVKLFSGNEVNSQTVIIE